MNDLNRAIEGIEDSQLKQKISLWRELVLDGDLVVEKFWSLRRQALEVAGIPDPMEFPGTAVHHLDGAALLRLTSQLPLPLARSLEAYAREASPQLKLHRLCDSLELLTRFMAVVVLSDAARINGGDLRVELGKKLLGRIERPSFGAWKGILEEGLKELLELQKKRPSAEAFLPGMRAFAEGMLLPNLGDGDGDAYREVIALRNHLAHHGSLSTRQVELYMEAHREPFCAVWEGFSQAFHGYLLFAADEAGEARLLHTADPAPSCAPRLEPGHVYLVRAADALALDLFPLQSFGDLLSPDETKRSSSGAVPQLYFRSQKERLEFTVQAEAADPVSRGSKGATEAFQSRFDLDKWRQKLDQERGLKMYRFGDFLDGADAVVGRGKEIETIKEALMEKIGTGGGVLFLRGAPGIGKSAVMEKVAKDRQGADKKAAPKAKPPRLPHLVIWYFFRYPDPRHRISSFMEGCLLQFAKKLKEAIEIPEDLDERRKLFLERLERIAKNHTVEFLLDGIDEVLRSEPQFGFLLQAATGNPNVTWLLAGRPEAEVETLMQRLGASPIDFAGGPKPQTTLSPLQHSAVQKMLFDRLPAEMRLHSGVVSGEAQRSGYGPVIDTIAERSEGLPLYVAMVLEEVAGGHRTLEQIARGELPYGLRDFFAEQMERYGGDVASVLAPYILMFVAAALEPLTEEQLRNLAARVHPSLAKDEKWKELFHLGLERANPMLRRVGTDDGVVGFVIDHDLFREYLRGETAEKTAALRRSAGRELIEVCTEWQKMDSLRTYALRQLPAHLFEAGSREELYRLARDPVFTDAQRRVLKADPAAPLRTLQTAVRAALKNKDWTHAAEFLLAHGNASELSRLESPLDVLRAGERERAAELANLNEPGQAVLWRLLLSRELLETENASAASEMMQPLLSQPLPRLEEWQAAYGAELMAWGKPLVPHELIGTIAARLFDTRGHWNLCVAILTPLRGELWEGDPTRILMDALEVGRALVQPEYRTGALSMVAFASHKAAQSELGSIALQETTASAADIEDPAQRAEALSRAARLYAEIGDAETSQETFASSHAAALQISRSKERDGALLWIASCYVTLGQIEAARALMKDISDPEVQVELLCAVVKQQAKQEQEFDATFQDGLQLALSVQPTRFGKRGALAKVIETSLEVAGPEDAFAWLAMLPPGHWQRVLLSRIVRAYAETGEVDLAMKLIERLDANHRHPWSNAAAAITVAQERAGRAKDAELLTRSISETAGKDGLETLARAQAAGKLFDSAERTLRLVKNPSDEILRDVSGWNAAAGHYEVALRIVERVDNDRLFRNSLLHIAQAQADDRLAAARDTLARGIVGRSLDRATTVSVEKALAIKAEILGKGSNPQAALPFIERLERQSERDRIRKQIAQTQGQNGNWSAAVEVVQAIEDARTFVRSCVELQEIAGRASPPLLAPNFSAAKEAARHLTEVQDLVWTMYWIAIAEIRFGGGEVKETVAEILDFVKKIGRGLRTKTLMNLAKSFAAERQFTLARQMADLILEPKFAYEWGYDSNCWNAALERIGREQARAWQVEDAWRTASELSDRSRQFEITWEIIEAHINQGNVEAASEILESTVRDPEVQRSAYYTEKTVELYIKLGRLDNAQRIALTIANDESSLRESALKKVISGHADAGHIEEALHAANSLGSAGAAARVLVDVFFCERRQLAATEKVEQDIITRIEQTHKEERDNLWSALADGQCRRHNFDQARRTAQRIVSQKKRTRALSGVRGAEIRADAPLTQERHEGFESAKIIVPALLERGSWEAALLITLRSAERTEWLLSIAETLVMEGNEESFFAVYPECGTTWETASRAVGFLGALVGETPAEIAALYDN